MNQSDRLLVQTTWAQLAPEAGAVAAVFYDRLFDIDPSLRALFARADLTEQGKKLTQMLAVAVAALDRLDQIVPAVEALGRRHVGYGVRDEHYVTVGQALLDALALGLGPAFTSEVCAAWTETYFTLAGVMRRAAAEQAAALRDTAALGRATPPRHALVA